MCGSRHLLAVAAAALALSLASCGGAEAPAPPASSERHGVAAADTICGEYRSFARAWAEQSGPQPSSQAVARLVAVKRSAATRVRRALAAVAGEPAVQGYLADVAASERLRRALAGVVNARSAQLSGELYAAQTRAYADGKALGLGECIGAPPRKPIGG